MRLKKAEKYMILIALLVVLVVCCASCIAYYLTANKCVSPLAKKYGNELPYEAMLVSKNLKNIILEGNVDEEELVIKLGEKKFAVDTMPTIENEGNVVVLYMQNDELLENEIIVKQYGARSFYKYEDVSLDAYVPHDITLADGKLKIIKGSFSQVLTHKKVIAEHSRLLKNFSGQYVNSGYLVGWPVDFPIIVIYSKVGR